MAEDRPLCPVCGEPVQGADWALQMGEGLVHGRCYLAKKAAAPMPAPERRPWWRRLMRRR